MSVPKVGGKFRTIEVADGAVQGLLESTDRFNLVESTAGTGKSTMLRTFDAGLRLSGESATYLATATRALDVLRKNSSQAEAVAGFPASEAMQRAARGGRLVIGEAGMLGHRVAYRLFAAAKRGDMRFDLPGRLAPSRLGRARHRDAGAPGTWRPATISARRDQASGGEELPARGRIARAGRHARRLRHAQPSGLSPADQKGETATSPSPRTTYRPSPTATPGSGCSSAEGEAIITAIRGMLRCAGRLGEDERDFTRLVAANWLLPI